MRALALSLVLFSAGLANADGQAAPTKPDPRFLGGYEGDGRACNGSLHLRLKSIEWHSTYSVCKAGAFEILDQDANGKLPQIAVQLKNPGKPCRIKVIELRLNPEYAGTPPYWDVFGYPSLEAYRKRDQPEWQNSPDPAREVLACMLMKTK